VSSNLKIPKVCQQCGNSFVAKTTVTKYCSTLCASRACKKRKREEKIQAALNETKAELQGAQTLQSLQTDNIQSKQFLSVKEASQLLGASRWTIQRMIQRQQIKVGKLGRRTIIPRTEIDNLFK